jgi:hypothetical protein
VSDRPDLRASDEDRDRVVHRLTEHAVAGRLTLSELEQRVETALRARTRGELDGLTRDLPAPDAGPGTGPRRRPAPSRWVVSVLGGADRKGRWRVGPRLNTICVLGGVDLDLREAEIEGDEVTILAVAVLGGSDIYLPDTIDVEMGGAAVLGGNDQRGSRRRPRPGAPVIRIQAYSLLGGIDVWRLPAETRGMSLRAAKRAAKELER